MEEWRGGLMKEGRKGGKESGRDKDGRKEVKLSVLKYTEGKEYE